MNSERAQAYGRVTQTLADLGPTKLLDGEQSRIRDAADTLLFEDDPQAPSVREAVADVADLAHHLVESGRWTDERAQRLQDDVAGCGPERVAA